jgi:hypothetical protein
MKHRMSVNIFKYTRASRLLRSVLPWAMAAAVMASPLSVTLAAHHKTSGTPAVPGIRSVALFAADNLAGTDGAVAADQLNKVLGQTFVNSGVYEGTTFNVFLPSVQRALNVDNTLSQSDIKAPINDPATAQRIATVMGTDGYILDEVDEFKVDPKTNAVTITVSGSLYSTSTGSSARAFAATGTATPINSDEGAENTTSRAIASAASQIAQSLGVPQRSNVDYLTPVHRSNSFGSVVLVALAVALAAVVVNNVHNNDNSSSSSSSSSSSGSPSSGTTTTTTGGSTGPPGAPGL